MTAPKRATGSAEPPAPPPADPWNNGPPAFWFRVERDGEPFMTAEGGAEDTTDPDQPEEIR